MTSKGKLEKLAWHQVKQDVFKVNPELANIIDELSPSNDYWVAKATYPYGSMVMEKSVLMLPNQQGHIVPITDPSIESSIQEGLGYNLFSNPVSIVLSNTFEIFLPLQDRTIPLSGLIHPGTAFGAWRMLNPGKSEQPIFIWDMTAGARSVFMLPKITEAKKHMQLCYTYNLTLSVPNSLMAHWEIFRQLANSPAFKNPWHAEILYFPQQWFAHLNDNQWNRFYRFFYQAGWGASEFWRNQPIWNLIGSLILKDYPVRPNAYIMDTVKYLLHVGMGALPGIAPTQNDLAGPFKEIQEIYQQCYALKNYPPTIMQPAVFNMYDPTEQPVYYSLQFPNALEFKPSSRIRTSIISDLHEIRSLMNWYERELLTDKFNISGTSLNNVFHYIQYDYFHTGVTLHKGMRNSNEMAEEDKRLVTALNGNLYNKFSDACSFVKGCIRLSHKKR